MNLIEMAGEAIKKANYLVFFGGAGTSTESGIPDFRGDRGMYKKDFKGYNPEEILHVDFVLKHTDVFNEFLKEKLCFNDVQPNEGHYALVKLEEIGKLKAIITQNIDSLHQKAGSKNVIELHGSLREYYCMRCGKQKNSYFSCECGGIVRPKIVLYGEALDPDVCENAINHIKNADTLIVSGTSLTVYPANTFIEYFNGENLILINTSPTQYDMMANIIIREPFAKAMKQIIDYINI